MYGFCRRVVAVLLMIIFRWHPQGVENIPAVGPVIIAANHISNFDPPVIGCAFSRKLHFMAKEELFRNLFLRWLFTKFCSFPVRRGAVDRKAIKTALGILAAGEVLGIFPEGRRSRDGKLGKPAPGLGMLALKSGAAIVPVAVLGTNHFSRTVWLPKFRVIFGKPIYITKGTPDKQSIQAIGEQVMAEIAILMERG